MLTPLQGDLLLDVLVAKKSENPNQLKFAIDTAETHGVPADQIAAVLEKKED